VGERGGVVPGGGGGGGGGGGQPPPNSEGTPKSCQTQPNCEKF